MYLAGRSHAYNHKDNFKHIKAGEYLLAMLRNDPRKKNVEYVIIFVRISAGNDRDEALPTEDENTTPSSRVAAIDT